MASIQSLGIAVSGLNAAQSGLSVTGHNMSNVYTYGYTRQQVLQNEFYYRNIGNNGMGALQVGLGTDVTCIRQIRDKFLDSHYRLEIKRATYYEVKYTVGSEIEQIVGETESEYSVQKVLENMWRAINELDSDPTSIANRGNFISTAIAFINRANNVYERLTDTQQDLNTEIISTVSRINELLIDVNELNDKIALAKASGDNPNDYLDLRNNALDELSGYLDLNIKERTDGTVDIFSEGNELLVSGMVNTLGLRYTSANYNFVEPVFTSRTDIIGSDEDPTTFKPLFVLTGRISPYLGNDTGSLKAMLVCRGSKPETYASNPQKPDPASFAGGANSQAYKAAYLQYEKDVFNAEQAFIPRVLKEFDTIVHNIVTMINDLVAPIYDANGNTIIKDANYKGPYGLDGKTQGIEVFKRKQKGYDRFDAAGNPIEEDPNDYYSLYTLGNIEINPIFKTTDGYTKLCLSLDGDIHDQQITGELLNEWSLNFGGEEEQSVMGAYLMFVAGFASETREAISFHNEQSKLIVQIDNKRSSAKDVSMDEELTFMMKYQHAYNAAARILNVIDSMIDKIVNGTGRVGL